VGRDTIQARDGGVRLGRKVTRDDITKWKELRDKGYTYEKIGKETEWGPETVRKYIGGEEKPPEKERKEPEADLELQARAFSEFEEGKNPVDLVREGICPIDVAKELGEKYVELKNMSRPNLEIIEARLGNASHLVRCALGHAKTEINCPVCHKWTHLTLQKINGRQRWACGNCGKIPF